jgi:CBS domain-containing protein
MAQTVQEVMTRNPRTLGADASIEEGARVMRDEDIGDVIVTEGDQVAGIATDRDIVVRAVADGREPAQTRLRDVASMDPTTISPTDSVDDAIRIMREQAVRRLPVCENGRAVGIVSLGDLAMERDQRSVLADVSAAPPNN